MVPSSCRSDRLVLEPVLSHRGEISTERPSPPVRVAIIGLVIFKTHRGERAEAALDFNGLWRCPKLPVLDRVLNALYTPAHDHGGDMPFGHTQLIRASAWLKGEVKWL